ncbi:MAG: DegT/DnrJ/EryC1/StrS family aminotransferase [Actinomycetota bacterium]|nr:DegT/DnrJ/EryC1/StrS family aminotransferase [Actinomycetota bacterium]
MTRAVDQTQSHTVPFLDLHQAHVEISEALLLDIGELLSTGAFTNGPQVRAFEEAFARFVGVDHCVGVASGLDALRLGLSAGGLEAGDEVVVPAMTFVATLEAVTQAGGVPVVVDISESDWNLDVAAVEGSLGPRTRFVLPVHLYGQMADAKLLRDVVTPRGVGIFEDACQSHGARRDGETAGAVGVAAGFSFYPGKNLGAIGDAGALTTNDAEVADHVRAAREHGQRRKYEHDFEGFTSRLDTIQALALLHKLPQLGQGNADRRAAAAFYSESLEDVGDLELPPVPDGSEPVWHLYVIRTESPDRLGSFLRDRGISTARHYPTPVHLTAAYRPLGYRQGEFPVAERHASRALSLPLFPGITDRQLHAAADAVAEYFERG